MYRFQKYVIPGSPVDVVRFMSTLAYDPSRFDSLDEYIDWLSQNLWKFHGIGVQFSGSDLESRCESLVHRLVEVGFMDVLEK
jgi:hypothetical protein